MIIFKNYVHIYKALKLFVLSNVRVPPGLDKSVEQHQGRLSHKSSPNSKAYYIIHSSINSSFNHPAQYTY